MSKPTRGEKNCNPGNLRESAGDRTQWQGERLTDDDKEFEEFTDPKYGIRALTRVLLSYHKQGLRTVRQIINRYAPTSENNTEAYIAAVCKALNVGPDELLPFTDASLYGLVRAIIRHENGRVIYDDATILAGVHLARQA